MGSCLVQQLFRQKIGQELDYSLVDEILFPMLRLRRHPSKELLQDIKLTQSFNENGHSAIVQIFYGGAIRNSSLFGNAADGWRDVRPEKRLRYGKNTSKIRRKTLYPTSWGSVDIMNELRESKTRYMIQFEGGTGMSLCLEEEPLNLARSRSLVPPPGPADSLRALGGALTQELASAVAERQQAGQLKHELLNEFIEQSLLPDKRLSWGGDPDRLFRPIMSTRY
jgi:hypothetical protein